MKKTFFLLITCSAMTLFTACGGGNSRQNNTAETVEREEVAQENVLSVDQLLAEAQTLTGKQIEVEGICTHICKHGGRKLFMMGSSDKKVMQIMATEELGAFTEECVNSMVRVKGTLKEDRIDEAYLVEWEQQLSQQTAPKHGDGKAGCDSEMKARGETEAATMQQRIDGFRKRIAERKQKEGKEYLSFYHVDGVSYEILK